MGGNRLLLVEDDSAIASMYRFGLEAAGWSVEVQPTGESGLAAALADPPTVLLLDVMLPGLSGLDVLRRLREHPRTRGCPVIVLTNSAGLPHVVNEASELRVVDWMVKSRTTPAELGVRLAAFASPERCSGWAGDPAGK